MTADSSIIDARAVSETETISRTLTVYDGHAFIGGGRLLPDTLIVKEHGESTAGVEDTDYTVDYTDDLLTIELKGALADATSLDITITRTLEGCVKIVPLLEGGRDPGQNTSVIAYERDEDRFWRIDCAYIPAHYPGTGDTFSSVLTGSLIQGDSLSIALDRAVQFVTLGIRATFGQGLPSREGILLERILGSLFAPVSTCKCRIMDGDGCCNPVLPFED